MGVPIGNKAVSYMNVQVACLCVLLPSLLELKLALGFLVLVLSPPTVLTALS